MSVERSIPCLFAGPRGLSRVAPCAVGLLLAVGGAARAQAPAAPPPPAAPAVPPAAAGVPPPPPPPPLPPGTHLGAGEVPIVAGNLASARERALGEALKQAVGEAIGALVPDAQSTQPKLVVQVLAKAKTFVRRYRTREDGEVGRGLYGVKIEADVDEAALQRAFERAPAGPGPTAAGALSYLLVASGPAEAADALARALGGGGTRVERARDALAPGQAVEAATRAGLGAVLLANATVTPEGTVRGVGLEAVSCAIAVRLVAAGTGAALAEDTRAERSFSEREADARKDCFARAAGLAVRHVTPQTGTGRSPSDLRTIVADIDVVEPGAVLAVLKHLRGSGSVSAVDVRRVLPGRAELSVRSRLTAPALAATLGRESTGPVVFSGVEVSGDLLRMVVRLREPSVPAAPVPSASSAAPPGTNPVPPPGANPPPARPAGP